MLNLESLIEAHEEVSRRIIREPSASKERDLLITIRDCINIAIEQAQIVNQRQRVDY